jgi:hypothetical protein
MIPEVGLENSHPGSSPGMSTAADKHLGLGYADLLLLFRKEWRLIPHGALEREVSRGKTGKGVPGILHPDQLTASGCGVG